MKKESQHVRAARHPLGDRSLRLLSECATILVNVAVVIGRVVETPEEKRERSMEAAFLSLLEHLAGTAAELGEMQENSAIKKKAPAKRRSKR